MKRVVDRIERIAGPVITLRAKNVAYGDLARVHSKDGSSLAQVIKLDGDEVTLQVFEGTRGVGTGDEVELLDRAMTLPVSDALLGRVLDGAGMPLDGRGPPRAKDERPLNTPSANPVRRRVPQRMVRTDIPMIDVFNTLVESQKLPIFSRAGEPHNALLAKIVARTDADVVVFGGCGLKHDELAFFEDALAARRARTVMFVHLAQRPVAECLAVPDLALAAGEAFARAGRRVLVLLTDVTAWCDALKEVAVAMDQIPANRGYPGDLYSQLAARYEKAVDLEDAGSLTLLTVTTLPGGDVTHPVPDNTGYITEGQLVLKDAAIDPFGSLSRLKQLVNKTTRVDHAQLADALVKLYDRCRSARQQRSMGFELSDVDRRALEFGADFEDVFMRFDRSLPLEDALDAGWRLLRAHFAQDEVDLPGTLKDRFWEAA